MDPGRTSRRSDLFLRIGDYAARKKGVVFALTALSVIVAVVLGASLKLDTDILDMVPRGNPKVDAFKSSLEEFGGIDYLMILLEAPEGHSVEEYLEFADAFAEILSDLPEVQTVEYRLGVNDALLDLFRRKGLLFLPPDQLPALERILSNQGIRRAIAEDRRILESPSSAFLEDLIRHDPLGVGRLVFARLLEGRQGLRLNTVDGYYMSEDGTALLMLVKPGLPAQDLQFTKTLVAAVRGAEREARELAAEDELDVADLSVSYGGTYIVTMVDSDAIAGDLRLTAVASLVGVLGVYLVGYRRLGALMYSAIPLLIGQALTFALAAIVLGRLNSASSGFVAMLMGLGTDFTIIMYARYVEARQDGMDVTDSVRRMMTEASLGVFTGAITSAGTFYALCTTEFLGLRELGLLIGSGMLFCLLAIFMLLPAMLHWNEGEGRRKRPPARLHVQSFGAEHIIPLAARFRRTVLVAGVVILALSLYVVWTPYEGWKISFSDNVRDLRNPDNPGLVVSERISQKFGGHLNVMMAILDAPTVDEALEAMGRIEERARPFVEDGTISGVDSLLQYLPRASDQRRVIHALREGSKEPRGAFSLERIESRLHYEARRQGFTEDAFDDYLVDLRAMLSVQDTVGVEALQGDELGALLGRYIRPAEGGYRAAVYLFMDQGRWRREAPPELEEALAAGDPSIVVTGVNVVSKELRTIFARDTKKAIAVGLVIVTVLLALDLRSFRLAMIANVQVLGGILIMFGIMSVADIELNFVNSFTAIMVLGFGVDYGIHLIHRLRSSGGVVDGGVMETGKAVTMAAITTAVGFGSLTLSHYPAMKSVGVVAILGSFCCLLVALTMIPAVMARPASKEPVS